MLLFIRLEVYVYNVIQRNRIKTMSTGLFCREVSSPNEDVTDKTRKVRVEGIQKKKMIKDENFEWLVLKLIETNLKGEYV